MLNMDDLSDEAKMMLLLFGLGIGLSVALIAWLISRALAVVPAEDREYKDPPPMLFRFLWWPIQWISFYITPFYSQKRQESLMLKLRKAGLDYALSPAQFIAYRTLWAIGGGAFGWWIVDSFNKSDLGEGAISTGAFVWVSVFFMLFGWFMPGIWLRDRLTLRRRELLKTLPFFLDIITLCVEAGLNFQGALNQAVMKGPKGVMRDEFMRVLRDIRAGKQRAVAMRSMAERLKEPSITNFIGAVIQAENMGMNLGPVLRAQADQRRSERFLRAEKLAMEAPVKMLFPLIAFIFPCTFIVLFFPIVMKFMESGL